MNESIVTILIPVYNSENTIIRTLDSIYNNETKYKYDVLIVNDGSTDNTRNLITEYMKTHQNIKCIDKENSGISDALNLGLNNITTKYIMRMDADDIMTYRRIEVQINIMEAHPEYDIIGGVNIDYNNGQIYSYTNEDVSLWILQYGNFYCHPSIVFRTKSINKVKLRYNPNFKHCEDYWLYCEAIIKGLKFHNCKNVVIEYYFNNNLKKSNYWKEQNASISYILETVKHYIKGIV